MLGFHDAPPTDGPCQPGETQCADPETIWVCTDELEWIPLACTVGTTCKSGVCSMCDPGEVKCLSTATYMTCADDGRAWSNYVPCEADHVCVGGACEDCQLVSACDSITSHQTRCIDDVGTVIWSESVSCQDDQVCKNATCIYAGCLPSVILVVDRSSSMEFHWPDVRDSVAQLVSDNPKVRFGLYAFPSDMNCEVPTELDLPFSQDEPETFSNWFDMVGTSYSTPLLPAMREIADLAPEALGKPGGAVVVVADGEDTCAYEPDLSAQLAEIATNLRQSHAIHTYVIGYAFGSPLTPFDGETQLDAMAKAGGTSYDTYIPAGNEEELTKAFGDIVVDWKLCLGEN